jgi:hypothetical protein
VLLGAQKNLEEPAGVMHTYYHSVPGRMRIRIQQLKAAPEMARRLESQLGAHAGISEVTANPTTGSVLIKYEPGQIEGHEILSALRRSGWIKGRRRPPHATAARPGGGPIHGTPVALRILEQAFTLVFELFLLRMLRLSC